MGDWELVKLDASYRVAAERVAWWAVLRILLCDPVDRTAVSLEEELMEKL